MSLDIPSSQIAFVFNHKKEHLEKRIISVKEPSTNNVLLKIEAAGLCHSDLHILDGRFKPFLHRDFVMGHEIVGTIVKYGPRVDKNVYTTKIFYAIHNRNNCGKCQYCLNRSDNLCTSWGKDSGAYGTYGDGGFQQFMEVDARHLVAVPEGVDPNIAAATTDAVLTPYHAMKIAKVNSKSKIIIIGLGGLGMNALQIAKALGAYVIGTDIKLEAINRAKSLGADEIFTELPTYKKIKGVDVVLDFVSTHKTFSRALRHIGAKGIIMPIGLNDLSLQFTLFDLASKEIKIMGSMGGTHQDLVECLELVKTNKVKPTVEIGEFDKLHDYFIRLKEGKLKSRMVVKPNCIPILMTNPNHNCKM